MRGRGGKTTAQAPQLADRCWRRRAATGQVCLPDASGASVEAVASGHGQGCLPDAPDALAPTTVIESETVSSAGGMMADAGCQGLASSVPAPPSSWGDRYFERQAPGGRCGRHALNDVLGVHMYDDHLMEQALQVVLADTKDHRALHCRGNGWHSHLVLAKALEHTVPPVWHMVLNPVTVSVWQLLENSHHAECYSSSREVAGVVCNEGNAHWTCITCEGGTVYYVDSYTAPVAITEARFTTILERHPMSFLGVRHDLDISACGGDLVKL